MQRKTSLLRKLSLVLGITALLLGLIPVSALGNVGFVSAEGEEPPVEEPKAPADEDPPELSLMAAIGDDPTVEDELPDFGNTYTNGDCVTHANCEVDEPVTNPNDYTDQGTYGEKTYVLPVINGSSANIVAIKSGNDWFFYKEGSAVACSSSGFCVEFDGGGNLLVRSYDSQGPNFKGFNLIHFWLGASEEDILGCTDPEALNYDQEATFDDGSCEYDDPGGGGGPPPVDPPPGGGGQLIPVTGADLSGVSLAELQLMLRSLGALFLGSNLVIGGVSKRKPQ
jgi:hypothetical protein